MKVLAVIPSRYQSSRLPGKPLADICGKPMIWWVYNKVSQVKGLDAIVATDDQRIIDVCNSFSIPCIMTGEHSTHISRVHEVSEQIDADYYVTVCGDEPLIEPEVISTVIPKICHPDECHVEMLMREMNEPTEVIDPGNIKVAVNGANEAIMLSRSPIPFPYKTIIYKYRKIMGVECYNKKALDLFVNTEPGHLEKIEDVTLLRFLENHVILNYHLVPSQSLSVDTNRDLEKVRIIIKNQIN